MPKKKDGGLIQNWQIHSLNLSLGYNTEQLLLDPGPIVFTGIVVEDSAGRWQPGTHMRSSYVCSIDREKGVIETVCTIYKVINEGSDHYGDMGNDYLFLFANKGQQ